MKFNINFLNFSKIVRLIQIRNYRGKYLTSYQQIVSKKEIRHDLLNKGKYIDLVAGLAVSDKLIDTVSNNNNTEEDMDIKNSQLVESCKIYQGASSDYRKLLFYGSENNEIKSSNFNCHGCGSNINCESVYNPGYIPYEVYKENHDTEEFMNNILCLRCFHLKNNIDPLDISLEKDLYYEIVTKQLKHYESGVIILLVDMSDLPFSIPADLNFSQFKNYRVVLVGNKIDLLFHPSKLSWHYKNCLINAAEQRGISKNQILFTHLISSKTCEFLESLVDRILSLKFIQNEPVFLIGSTNTGKSTVFNRLLKSDLCKTIVKSHIKQAIVSNLPGTTLNLLRFPICNYNSSLLKRRVKAKKMLSLGELKSSKEKYPLLDSSEIITKQNTLQLFDEMATYSLNKGKIMPNILDEQGLKMKYDKSYKFDASKITTNRWFYDTPGLINPDQLINYFNKVDVDELYAGENLNKPKIFVMRPGLSIIMQNIGRIDIVEAINQIYLSIHSRLPVEIVETHDIDRYFQENNHFKYYWFKNTLSPPLLNKIHSKIPDYNPNTSLIPPMMSVDMEFTTEGYDKVTGDVILSSIGWVGISGYQDEICKIRAWTPAAIGCDKRIPALIPTAVKRRQHRKANSREFTIS